MLTCLTVALIPFGACTGDSPVDLAAGDAPSEATLRAASVGDLTVTSASDSSLTLTWTQVDDGAGHPALYRIKYAPPAIAWRSATIGCDVVGDRIGAPISCEVPGLAPDTGYELQLMSYRLRGDVWQGATYSNIAAGSTVAMVRDAPTPHVPAGSTVQDLEVTETTSSSLRLGWTEIDDGTGNPARYRVRYAGSMVDWKAASFGCNVSGREIGAEASCLIEGLDPSTSYDVQLMSYRTVEGVWADAKYSNIATRRTDDEADREPNVIAPGVWISRAEVRALPTSGTAWNNVRSAADRSCGRVDLSDQNQSTNVCIMAKALVFARTGEARYRTDVVTAISQIVSAGTYSGRALALGRELGAYVIAADLIDLKTHDPSLDSRFRSRLVSLRTARTTGAASNLIDCHERRPNNWGTHCGATRAAIAVYLDDQTEIARVAQVFKGFLGDRSSYSGFQYGGPANSIDLSWQCSQSRPVGINPAGCSRNGLSLDGVIPDDQRRGGSFTTRPAKENYVWEALQGILAQAVILHGAGYPVWEWEDRAILRAVTWLHEVVDYPAEGDDTWQPHLVNRYYGTNFPAPTPSRPGKNVGWTDWTHR